MFTLVLDPLLDVLQRFIELHNDAMFLTIPVLLVLEFLTMTLEPLMWF